ncbi:hypothetical protein HDU78_010148 [Chytriomyces hyalinus]|nr:hypothetical protein HDU78_010148 [Chytriomyces hyalinus]
MARDAHFSIFALTWLYLRNLANNKFQGRIPKDLASVTTLDLSGNKFSGAIPDELLHSGLEFANLVTRKLNRNRLTGKPPVLDAFGSMMNVLYVCIVNNYESMKRLNLVLLDLSSEASGNLLKGPLLGSCVETSFLDRLDLSGNEISGSFPTGVSSCDFLTSLNLASNKLKGSIPEDAVQSLSDLQYLNLTGNKFSGSLPAALGDLKQLTTL